MFNDVLDKLRNFSYRYRPLPDFYGSDFRNSYAFLQRTSQWSKEQIQEYKLNRIKQLVRHAEENVPYYRRKFADYGVGSRGIKDFDDLARFPVLTKDDLVNNFDKLKADDFEQYKPLEAKTAGTTGQMTRLYRGIRHESFRKAVLWSIYNRFGYEFRQPRVTVDDPPSFRPDSTLYEHDKIENKLTINTYHLMAGKADLIHAKIKEFAPRMIWGHPTFLAILGEYALKNNLEPLGIPLVATYAEKIYPYTRALINAFCRGEFIDYYGNKENTIAAWGYSDNRFYEVSEYCHFEVLEGSLDFADRNSGDLITTSLHYYAFPLIRYLPGDIVTYHGYVNSEIPYPRVELHGGRGKDLLLSPNGLTIPHLVDYLEKADFIHLRKHQIEQVSLDKIIVRIVPEKSYIRKIHEPILLKLARDSTANLFDVELEYVDDIPLTARGKFPAIISKPAVESIRAKLDSLKKSEHS